MTTSLSRVVVVAVLMLLVVVVLVGSVLHQDSLLRLVLVTQ